MARLEKAVRTLGEVKRLAEAGCTRREIREQTGFSKRQVEYLCQLLNLNPPRSPRKDKGQLRPHVKRRWSQETIDAVRDLAELGRSISYTATVLGLTRDQVSGIAFRNGISFSTRRVRSSIPVSLPLLSFLREAA